MLAVGATGRAVGCPPRAGRRERELLRDKNGDRGMVKWVAQGSRRTTAKDLSFDCVRVCIAACQITAFIIF